MSMPFMPIYWGDYFRDTRHLTCEQHGAYLQLLGSMWNAGGSLPDDDKKLARFTGCTASRWAKISAEVLDFFDRQGGEITHKRLMFELEKAQEKSIIRSRSGIKGAQAKALKNKNMASANASANAEPLLKHSSEPEPEEIIDTVVSKSLSSPRQSAKSQMDGFDDFWSAYPRKVAKGAAERSYAKALSVIADPDPPSVLRSAAERFAASNPDPQFTPHPATWLNSRRWEDETDERPDPSSSQTARGGQSPSEARRAGAALAIAQLRAARGGEADDGGGYPGAQVVSFRG
jgi:uncharacterized protein YdaU (DUF1376 family)